MKIAIYPGSFDPITVGHFNIIKSASSLFDFLVIGILDNLNKKYMFTKTERLHMVKASIKSFSNVSAEVFSGLTVDFCKKKGAHFIVRGIRHSIDISFEMQMAHVNKKIDPKIETIFIPTDSTDFCVSSSLIKELAILGGDISELVPNITVKECIMKKVKKVGEK